jgi:hypothetical protein
MPEKIKQFNDSFDDLWGKHRAWVILLMAALLFDTLTTIHFMLEDKIHFEIHPLVRYSALFLGPVVGTVLSAFCYKIIVSILLAMYYRPLRFWVLILPAIFSTLAGFYNLYGH